MYEIKAIVCTNEETNRDMFGDRFPSMLDKSFAEQQAVDAVVSEIVSVCHQQCDQCDTDSIFRN